MMLEYGTGKSADIPAIFAQAKALVDAYEDVSAIDYDWVMDWTVRKITQKIGDYTRVTVDGELCAYYRLTEEGELDDFYVLPSFRGRGIGSAILTRCTQESKVPLWLYVFTKNKRAVSLYRRFGFVPSETVGQTRQIMRRVESP